MTKTQINDNSNDTVIFNFTRYKIMMFLIGGALAIFGTFKLIAYTENRKIEADRQALAELMKDDFFVATREYLDNPNPSEKQKFMFSCLLHGMKKSRCEDYMSMVKK